MTMLLKIAQLQRSKGVPDQSRHASKTFQNVLVKNKIASTNTEHMTAAHVPASE